MATTEDLLTGAVLGAVGGVMGTAIGTTGVSSVPTALTTAASAFISDPMGSTSKILVPAGAGAGLVYFNPPQLDVIPGGVLGKGLAGGLAAGLAMSMRSAAA